MFKAFKSLCFCLSLRGFLVYPVIFSLLLAGFIFATPAQPANATNFTVNTTYNGVNDGDATPGDGLCKSIINANQCTLRAAIQEANTNANSDVILIDVVGNIITFTNYIGDIKTNITIKSNNGSQVFLDCKLPYTASCSFFGVTSAGQLRLESIRLRFAGTTALSNGGGVLFLQDSAIEHNICEDGGCGLYASGGTTTINNTTFFNNKITDIPISGGGAIFATNSRLEIYESTFTSNTATVANNTNIGGALSLSNSELVISRTTFAQNQALNGGGAIYIQSANANKVSRIHETAFTNNSSTNGKGGAIWLDIGNMTGGSFTIQNSTLLNNVANIGGNDTPVGSAVYVRNQNPNSQNPTFKTFITNNTFEGNDSKGGRGAIAIENDSPAELIHNTIYANLSTSGRGGLVAASGVNNPVVKLQNNILALNSGSDISGSFNVLTPNLVKAPNGDIFYTGAPGKVITGLDPKLSVLTYQGPSPSYTNSQSRRPLNYSPVLNAGETVAGITTDQTTVNSRVFGGKPDLGSYEVQVAPPVIDPNGPLAGTSYTAIYRPGSSPVSVVEPTTALLSDQDSANLDYLEVKLNNPPDGAAESLSVDTSGTSITATYNPNTFTLTLQGVDTRLNYQTVLRRVKYSNSNPTSSATRTINYVAGDGYVYSDRPGVSSSVIINFGQLVETTLDNGQANQIGTLSYAINWVNSQTDPNRRTVLFLPELTQVIVQTGSLPELASGSKINAGCVNGQPQITINGNNILSSRGGLVLKGNNQISGLRIYNFNASKPQLLALSTNGKNTLSCVRVSY